MSDQIQGEWTIVSSKKVRPQRQPSNVSTNSKITTIDENKTTKEDDELSYSLSHLSQDLSVASAKDDINLQQSQKGPIELDDFSLQGGISRMRAHWKVVLAGQFLSLLLAIAGASTSTLYLECNVNIPASQTFLVYLMMSFHTLVLFCREKGSNEEGKTSLAGIFDWRYWMRRKRIDKSTEEEQNEQKIQNENTNDVTRKESDIKYPYYLIGRFVSISVPSWTYALLAFIRVQADFFTYLALRYTTLTSAAVFDNISILSALICSRVFLKRYYKSPHILGAAICCLGVTINLVSDYESDLNGSQNHLEERKYPYQMLGDFYAIVGGLLLGIGDVANEAIVKDGLTTTHEYIGCVGLFGALILFIQSYMLEMDDIDNFFASGEMNRMLQNQSEFSDIYEGPMTCSRESGIYLLSAFVFSSYFLTTGICYFLAESEAALLAISVLSADLWTVVFSLFVGIAPSLAFYIGLAMVIAGLITYEMAPSPISAELDHLDISDGMSLHESKIGISEGVNIPPGNVMEMSNISLSWDVEEKGTKPELL